MTALATYDSLATSEIADSPNFSASSSIVSEEFSKETFTSLKKYVQEGDTNLKSTGFVASAGLMITGFVSCMAHIFDLDLTNALLDVVICFCGYVCR